MNPLLLWYVVKKSQEEHWEPTLGSLIDMTWKDWLFVISIVCLIFGLPVLILLITN